MPPDAALLHSLTTPDLLHAGRASAVHNESGPGSAPNAVIRGLTATRERLMGHASAALDTCRTCGRVRLHCTHAAPCCCHCSHDQGW